MARKKEDKKIKIIEQEEDLFWDISLLDM